MQKIFNDVKNISSVLIIIELLISTFYLIAELYLLLSHNYLYALVLVIAEIILSKVYPNHLHINN